jgi:hypothetical protein
VTRRLSRLEAILVRRYALRSEQAARVVELARARVGGVERGLCRLAWECRHLPLRRPAPVRTAAAAGDGL